MRRAMVFLPAWLALSVAAAPADAGESGTMRKDGWDISGLDGSSVGVSSCVIGVDNQGCRFVAVELFHCTGGSADHSTGRLPSTTLTFTLLAGAKCPAARVYIVDDVIRNHGDEDWYAYTWILSPPDVASFNRELTDPGARLCIEPFRQWQWTLQQSKDRELLTLHDGQVPAGQTFMPGRGAGNLVIDIRPEALARPDPGQPVRFTLSQYAAVPEPSGAKLLLAGAVLALRRRR